MENNSIENIKSRIIQGLDLVLKKLIEKKSKEDGELVFYQNGQIVHVKAKDLNK